MAAPHPLHLHPPGSTASASRQWTETSKRLGAWCLAASSGAGVCKDTGGHVAFSRAGPRPPLRLPQDLPGFLHHVTSWEDKRCPHSWMSWRLALGRHVLHTSARSQRGSWGPTELMGASRACAPVWMSPGHRGDVRSAAAGGPWPQLPRDDSTCTLETPGFL